jgi:hypothetical protein
VDEQDGSDHRIDGEVTRYTRHGVNRPVLLVRASAVAIRVLHIRDALGPRLIHRFQQDRHAALSYPLDGAGHVIDVDAQLDATALRGTQPLTVERNAGANSRKPDFRVSEPERDDDRRPFSGNRYVSAPPSNSP